jgi:MFS family permease
MNEGAMENDLRAPLLPTERENDDEDRATLQQSHVANSTLDADITTTTTSAQQQHHLPTQSPPPPLQSPHTSYPDTDTNDDHNEIQSSFVALPTDDNNVSNNNNDNNPWKNHNVILSLALCVVSGIADSIWSSVVLSGFLLALAGKMGQSKEGNTLVGGAEAAQGLTQLITALPVGYLADTWGKSKTVRYGGIFMLMTIGLTLGALIDVKHHADESTTAAKRSYIILVIALAFWGIISGIANGPSQALYSDSIRKGKRSEMLTWLFSCYLMSSTVGPIVSIVMILTVSAKAEEWSINEIYPVFLLGVILEVPAAILMLFFNDKYSVVEEEEEGTNNQEEPATDEEIAPLHNGAVEENGLVEESTEVTDHNQTTTVCTTETLPNTDATGTTDEPTSTLTVPNDKKYIIPYVLFASSLISSLGSGASVKYFPLFFKEVGFGSAAVQGIFLVVPVSISCFSFVAQEAGKRFGRVETSVASIVIGVSLLFLMTVLSHNLQQPQIEDVSTRENSTPSSLWDSNPYKAMLIVVVYLFRTGIINSSYPLLESILMDNVPSNQRARWKSLESIASFGWTGSALVGGILSDEHSYQFTFAITAWMQLASGLVLLIIQPYVERE